MKKIAIICFSNFSREPRVLRTIHALKNHFNITIFSDGSEYEDFKSQNVTQYNLDYEESNLPFYLNNKSIRFFRSNILGYSFQSQKYFERKYWKFGREIILGKINQGRFDLVIGHGIYTLPILANIKKPIKTIFNAHEYYLKEFEENKIWVKYSLPYYQYILDTYYRRIDLTFAVSKTILKEYEKHYTTKLVEVTNATKFQDIKWSEPTELINIVHHGGAIRTRNIELMIKAVLDLPKNYILHLMLVKTDIGYYNELLKFKSDKIIFIDPVPVEEIAKTISKFDIGLFILPPVNYNWLNALPNKLFEFIQARLCVVVSPNPDMKKIVEDYDLGIVIDDYTAESATATILKIEATKLIQFKKNANIAANILNAEKTERTMLNEVNKLLTT